jgi:uncharacterized protein
VNRDLETIINGLQAGSTIGELSSRYQIENLESLVNHLVHLGYLVPKGFDQRKAIAEDQANAVRAAIAGKSLRSLRLYVTLGCNFDCSYCLNPKLWNDSPEKHMSPEVARLAVRSFLVHSETAGVKQVSIRFFGGEPLLNLPAIEAAIAESELHLNIKTELILNTNASLLTRSNAARFKAKSSVIIVSLDGPGPVNDSVRRRQGGTGSFDSILRGIDAAVAEGARVVVSCVVTETNRNNLRALVDVVRAHGVSNLGLNYAMFQDNPDYGTETADAIFDAYLYGESVGVKVGGLWGWVFRRLNGHVPSTFCAGEGSEFSVMPNGDVHPCSGITRKLGHISDVDEVMNSPLFHEISARRAGSLPNCRNCFIEGLCAGGCAAEASFRNGRPDLIAREDCDLLGRIATHYLQHMTTVAPPEVQEVGDPIKNQ